jgi:hypothetical protein
MKHGRFSRGNLMKEECERKFYYGECSNEKPSPYLVHYDLRETPMILCRSHRGGFLDNQESVKKKLTYQDYKAIISECKHCPGDKFFKKFDYVGRLNHISACKIHIKIFSGIEMTEDEYKVSILFSE